MQKPSSVSCSSSAGDDGSVCGQWDTWLPTLDLYTRLSFSGAEEKPGFVCPLAPLCIRLCSLGAVLFSNVGVRGFAPSAGGVSTTKEGLKCSLQLVGSPNKKPGGGCQKRAQFINISHPRATVITFLS